MNTKTLLLISVVLAAAITVAGCASKEKHPPSPEFTNTFVSWTKEQILFTGRWRSQSSADFFIRPQDSLAYHGGLLVATDEAMYLFVQPREFPGENIAKNVKHMFQEIGEFVKWKKIEPPSPTEDNLIAVWSYPEIIKLRKRWGFFELSHQIYLTFAIDSALGGVGRESDAWGSIPNKEAMEMIKVRVEAHGGSLKVK